MEKCTRQYVYMIRPREFIRLNENTYKIGKTTQNPNSRLTGYPKGSEVLAFICVNDCDTVEKELMGKFISEFKQALEYGREYFTGNEGVMLTKFIAISTSNLPLTSNECRETTKITEEQLGDFIFEPRLPINVVFDPDRPVKNKELDLKIFYAGSF